jgi:hypothetical protein
MLRQQAINMDCQCEGVGNSLLSFSYTIYV